MHVQLHPCRETRLEEQAEHDVNHTTSAPTIFPGPTQKELDDLKSPVLYSPPISCVAIYDAPLIPPIQTKQHQVLRPRKIKTLFDAQQKDTEMPIKDMKGAWFGLLEDQMVQDWKEEQIKEIKELTANLDALRLDMEILIKDKESLIKERDAATKAHAELVKQLRQLQAAKDEEAAEHKCCQEELTRCQRDLAQTIAEKHTASLRNLDKSMSNLTSKLDTAQDNYTFVKKQDHIEKEKYVKELTCEIDTLRGNAKVLTAEIDASRQKMDLISQDNSTISKSLEVAETRLKVSKKKNLWKENCIKALTDLNKEMKSIVDAQKKEISIVLATSQHYNMEKDKHMKQLTCEIDTLQEKMSHRQEQEENFRVSQKKLQEQLEQGFSLQEQLERGFVAEVENIKHLLQEQLQKGFAAEIENIEKGFTAEVDRLEKGLAVEVDNCIALSSTAMELTAERDALLQRMTLMSEQHIALANAVDASLTAQEQEFEIVLAASRQDNMEKMKLIDKLTFELYVSHGHAKELTAELDALRLLANSVDTEMHELRSALCRYRDLLTHLKRPANAFKETY